MPRYFHGNYLIIYVYQTRAFPVVVESLSFSTHPAICRENKERECCSLSHDYPHCTCAFRRSPLRAE